VPNYGKSSIQLNSGTFNLSQWNALSNIDKGIESLGAIAKGGYGLAVDSNSYSQLQPSASTIKFGDPIMHNVSEPANVGAGNTGQQFKREINNNLGLEPMQATVNFSTTVDSSLTAGTSWGLSNTNSIEIGAEVSAEFAGIGASLSTSITSSTTIESGGEQSTSKGTSQTVSFGDTYTVPAGYSAVVTGQLMKETVSIPFTMPVIINGSKITLKDKWGNYTYNGANGTVYWSAVYGNPMGWAYSKINDNSVSINVPGVINSVDYYNYSSKIQSMVKYDPSVSARRKSGAINQEQLGVFKNGDENLQVGAYYDSDEWQDSDLKMIGSDNSDTFEMSQKGQVVITHKGSDVVYGSKYNDEVISNGHDYISLFKGDDTVHSKRGASNMYLGGGNDTAILTLSHGDRDILDVGNGKDKVTMKIKGSGGYATINGLQTHDHIAYSGKNKGITAEQLGGSVIVKQNGKDIAYLNDVVTSFHKLGEKKDIHDLGFMNMDMIVTHKDDNDGTHKWMDYLIEGFSTGGKFISKFEVLKNDTDKSSGVIDGIVNYLYEDENQKKVDKAVDYIIENPGKFILESENILQLTNLITEYADDLNLDRSNVDDFNPNKKVDVAGIDLA
jgi:hypothetical protein